MDHLTFKHPIIRHTQLRQCIIMKMRNNRWPRSGIPTKCGGLLTAGLLVIHPLTRLPENGDEEAPQNIHHNVYESN